MVKDHNREILLHKKVSNHRVHFSWPTDLNRYKNHKQLELALEQLIIGLDKQQIASFVLLMDHWKEPFLKLITIKHKFTQLQKSKPKVYIIKSMYKNIKSKWIKPHQLKWKWMPLDPSRMCKRRSKNVKLWMNFVVKVGLLTIKIYRN